MWKSKYEKGKRKIILFNINTSCWSDVTTNYIEDKLVFKR